MKIECLLHIIRASAQVTGGTQFLVIGSQAVLGHFRDKDTAFSFDASADADIVALPENPMQADLIDGNLGECSSFHRTYGYYAHGSVWIPLSFPKAGSNVW